MTATFDAAGTALVDQAQAAARHTLAALDDTARLNGGRLEMLPLHGPRAAMLQSYVLLLLGNRVRPCPHLSPTAPQPEFWCAWKPGRLSCAPCCAALGDALDGTAENNRCDHCGRLSDVMHIGQVMMPATVAPALRIASGPTVLLFGFCPACHRASGNAPGSTLPAENGSVVPQGTPKPCRKPRGRRGRGRGKGRR